MGKLALLIVLQMLILFITFCLCLRSDDNNSTWCVEEERQALLTFKHSFRGSYNHRLWSWQGRDCCGWDGVGCDKSTGHVIKLDLRAPTIMMDVPYYYPWERLETKEQMKGLTYLNFSSTSLYGIVPHHLGNLSNLEFLDLSGNELYVDDFSWVSTLSSLQHLGMKYVDLSQVAPKLLQQVLTQLPSLLHLDLSCCGLYNTHIISHPSTNSTFSPPTLRYLGLSGNGFYGPIPNSLQNLTSIEVLDLSFNNFNSSIPLWLGNFKNLRSLNLAYNKLNSPNGEIWLILRNLSILKSLDLSYNQFSGIIPSSIGKLTFLSTLNMSNNQLAGTIPSSFWKLTALTELDLSNNYLNGTISKSLGQLSNLTMLDISNNRFNGIIPESIGQLVNLESLFAGSNALEGVVSSKYHLANLSSLKSLSLGSNLVIEIQTEPNWIPPFQLEYVGLSSCKFETGEFPIWLQTQNQLYNLDLSNMSISDSFPLWLLEDKLSFHSLDFSHNQIKGPLPSHLVNGTKTIYEVIMTDNMLNGSIPNWFCNIKFNLGTLDLSRNSFSGHIPNCWNNNQELAVIDLSSNQLSGIIPSSITNMTYLQWLMLSNNSLTGPIPLSLSKVNLSTLDLACNMLSGNIPTWIGESIYSLQILSLRNNKFNGIIPPQLCRLPFLQIIDLADNDLEGTLPSCLGNLTTMTSLGSLTNNEYMFAMPQISYEEWNKSKIRQVVKGREFEYTSVLRYLVNMDFSSNRLVGSIPQQLTHLSNLVGFNLSHNQLSGNIPEKIGDMRSLQSLDLSHNYLSGEIPNTLSTLTSLSYLKLSSNNLEGKIPHGNQLQTFNDLSIYEGNPLLCGPPLLQPCPGNNPTRNGNGGDDRNEDNDNSLEKMWFYIVVMTGYATGFWAVVGVLLAKKRWRHAYFT